MIASYGCPPELKPVVILSTRARSELDTVRQVLFLSGNINICNQIIQQVMLGHTHESSVVRAAEYVERTTSRVFEPGRHITKS